MDSHPARYLHPYSGSLDAKPHSHAGVSGGGGGPVSCSVSSCAVAVVVAGLLLLVAVAAGRAGVAGFRSAADTRLARYDVAAMRPLCAAAARHRGQFAGRSAAARDGTAVDPWHYDDGTPETWAFPSTPFWLWGGSGGPAEAGRGHDALAARDALDGPGWRPTVRGAPPYLLAVPDHELLEAAGQD